METKRIEFVNKWCEELQVPVKIIGAINSTDQKFICRHNMHCLSLMPIKAMLILLLSGVLVCIGSLFLIIFRISDTGSTIIRTTSSLLWLIPGSFYVSSLGRKDNIFPFCHSPWPFLDAILKNDLEELEEDSMIELSQKKLGGRIKAVYYGEGVIYRYKIPADPGVDVSAGNFYLEAKIVGGRKGEYGLTARLKTTEQDI